MPKRARWGRPYKDTRDWTVYNERLVKRGEFYLSLDFIEKWDEYLAQMNACKRGHPFLYPELFIHWMAIIHLFLRMPYRQMEGFTRKLSKYIPDLKSADYTTLYRRITNLNLSLSVNPEMLSENVVVAVDSTGIKVSNRGEWMREKWRVRRGWIKVHAMIDVETNQILGLEVTDESVQDEQVFDLLLAQTTSNCNDNRVKMVLGDGGYDRNDIFTTLEKRRIQSGIKTRQDASTRSTGSAYRAECVRERNKLGGYNEWSVSIGYGKRWKVEGVFSSIKRIFGESVSASSVEGMMKEAMMKCNCYNMLVAMT